MISSASLHDDTIPVGTALDSKWRIDAQLGRGGMGVVYAATHVRNQSRVAIKVLHRELSRDAALRDRFLQEGYAANQVGHPGTVRVLDDGTTPDGHTYLVMERLEGQPLDAVAEAAGGKLPLADVMRYAAAVLDVIAAAHDKGIVHRDLKPENFFLCRDGTIKVLDFGIAQVKEAQTKARLTVTGVPMGTPAFMPPEQALALWERVDARADVYAVGATIVTLLTGRLVHEARTLPELLVMVSTRPAPPARSLAPELPVALAGVLDRALAFDPPARWANARAMGQALSAALSGHPTGVAAHPAGVAGPGAARPTVVSGHGRSSWVDQAAPGSPPVDGVSVAAVRGAASSYAAKPVGVQTAAPVSSSSKNTERKRAQSNGALMVLGAVFGVSIAAAGAYFLVWRAAPTNTTDAERAPAAATPGPAVDAPGPSVDAPRVATAAASVPNEPASSASASSGPAGTVAPAASATSDKPPIKPGAKPPPPKPTSTPAPSHPSPNPLDYN